MERRFLPSAACPVQLERRVGSDPPTIVGYAACFYRADDPGTEYELWNYDGERCVERIMPTAFDAALSARADCVGLYNHNPDHVLGRTSAGTMTLVKDARGLRYSITPPDSPLAQGVIASIQRQDLAGSSFSFQCDKDGQRFIRQGDLCVREIHSCRIFDVGPVTFPAYGATTTGMRAAVGADEARAAFDAWQKAEVRRQAALAQAQARARCAELGL